MKSLRIPIWIFVSILSGNLGALPGKSFEDKIQPSPPRYPRIVLDLVNRDIKVLMKKWQLGPWPVAIGAPETPTPYGQFAITKMIKNPVYVTTKLGRKTRHKPGPRSPIGDRYMEFHRNQRGVFAIHGTPWPIWVLSRSAVSNGCVRMLNKDIRELFDAVQPGTPLEIVN